MRVCASIYCSRGMESSSLESVPFADDPLHVQSVASRQDLVEMLSSDCRRTDAAM